MIIMTLKITFKELTANNRTVNSTKFGKTLIFQLRKTTPKHSGQTHKRETVISE